jgi:hypothetical protein
VLTPGQKGYPVLKKELLTIVFAMQKFHNWLYRNHFKLFTDHEALIYLFRNASENKIVNFWYHIINEYDCEIIHLPGIHNVIPDYLSRLYSQSNLFAAEMLVGEQESDSLIGSQDLIEDVNMPTTRHCSEDVYEQKSLYNLIVDDKMDINAKSLEELIRDLVDKKCPDVVQRKQLLKQVHGTAHQGASQLSQQLWHAGYFWPGMLKDCRKFVMSCKKCLKHIVHRAGFHLLRTVDAMYPFNILGIDTFEIGDGVKSDGYSKILIVTDYATAFTFLIPIQQGTAECVVRELHKLFGVIGQPL